MRRAVNKQKQLPGPDSLAKLIQRLGPKRQEIIRPLLEQPRGYVLLSLRDLADKLHSAPATLLRIVRDMGFASYHDFRRYLHELTVEQATSLDVMESTPASAGLVGTVLESLNQDQSNLRGLRHSLDMKRIPRLTKRLCGAERILVLGADMAVSLAYFLEYNFTVLGLNALSAISAGQMVHRVRHLTKKDVVIAISYRRGLRQTVEGLQQAHARGVYCIGITDSLISPIARFADECYLTPTGGPTFSGSYVAPMAFLNILLVACSNYRRSRTLALMKEAAKEQRSGSRWYREN